MARGDFTLFQEFVLDLGKGVHNLSTGVLKMAIIDNIVTPTAADATPRWGVGSEVDYDANEVSAVGSYTAGGETLDTVTYTEAAGVATLDAAAEVIAQDAAGFTNGYWGILYNETATNNEAIGFLDLGGPVSQVDGPITITPNASGIATITVT